MPFNHHLLYPDGIMHYVNGDVYSGAWENGFYHGKGSIRFTHGESYEGD